MDFFKQMESSMSDAQKEGAQALEARNFKIKQFTEVQLIEAAQMDEGQWIIQYAAEFNRLCQDQNLLNRLGAQETHEEALEEIKQKLYTK